MKIRPRLSGALGAFALAVAAIPLTALTSPAVSSAQDNCDFNFFYNTVTNQCQFCDTGYMYWNYPANLCLLVDPTPYVDPILGPAGPIGVGPNPVVGPVGPVGVGPDPVVGPVGPVGVGGLGPVAGPVGPVGVGGPVLPLGPGRR
ncbi:MAG: hypothetical protein KDB56_07355 [Mycobacterium sp.]|nr:hypothetical protein [Mycobacterium sp.]